MLGAENMFLLHFHNKEILGKKDTEPRSNEQMLRKEKKNVIHDILASCKHTITQAHTHTVSDSKNG